MVSSDGHSAAAPSTLSAAALLHAAASAGVARGIRLVHPEVDDHVGIDLRDQLDDPRAIPWIHPVELGSVETAPRRVDVDADELRDPGFLLEPRCHERAELASHSAHDHPPLLHQPETYWSSSHAG